MDTIDTYDDATWTAMSLRSTIGDDVEDEYEFEDCDCPLCCSDADLLMLMLEGYLFDDEDEVA